jgi:predicted nucleotidyltransferase
VAIQNFAEKIITRLADSQVEFIVAGGVSGILQGAPITTQDIDLCYRRTPVNLSRLASALAPLQPRLRGVPPGLPNIFDEHTLNLGTNFTLEIEDEKLDLLGEMIAIGNYEQLLNQIDDFDVAGHTVKVLRLEDLIKTKRAAGRPKDVAVLPILEATLKMKQQDAGDDLS